MREVSAQGAEPVEWELKECTVREKFTQFQYYIKVLHNITYCSPNNAKCLILPVKMVLHYLFKYNYIIITKYLASDRVQT